MLFGDGFGIFKGPRLNLAVGEASTKRGRAPRLFPAVGQMKPVARGWKATPGVLFRNVNHTWLNFEKALTAEKENEVELGGIETTIVFV